MNSSLQGRAIQFALDKEWNKAKKINQKILKNQPNDKKALLRLGKAFMHLENYSEAKKAFKKVLELDSINRIAKKNLRKIKSEIQVKV